MGAAGSMIDPVSGLPIAPRDTTFGVLNTDPPPSWISTVYGPGTLHVSVLQEVLVSTALDFLSKYTNVSGNIEAATRTLEVFFQAALEDNYQFDNEKMKNAKAWLFITVIQKPPRRQWHRDGDTYSIGGPSRYSMAMLGPPTDVLVPSSMVDSIVPNSYPTSPLVAMLERQPRRPLGTGQIYRFSTG